MKNHLWSILSGTFLVVCFMMASCAPTPSPTPAVDTTPTPPPPPPPPPSPSASPTPDEVRCPDPDAVVTVAFPTFSGTNPSRADRAENFDILLRFDQPVTLFDDNPKNWDVLVARYVPYRKNTLEKYHDLTASAHRLPATVNEVSQLGTHSIRIRSSLVEEHPLKIQEWLAGWYQDHFKGTFGNRITERMTRLTGTILGEVDLVTFEGEVCFSGTMQGNYSGMIEGSFTGMLAGIITYGDQYGYSGFIEGTLSNGLIQGEYQLAGQTGWHPVTLQIQDDPFDFKDENGLPWQRFRGFALGNFHGTLRGEYDGLGYLDGQFDGTLDGEYDQDFYESGLIGTITCIDARILGFVNASFTGQIEGWYTEESHALPFWGLICSEENYHNYLAAANHEHDTYRPTAGIIYVDQVYWAYRGRTFALGDQDGKPCDEFCTFSGYECCIACVICPSEPDLCPIEDTCP